MEKNELLSKIIKLNTECELLRKKISELKACLIESEFQKEKLANRYNNLIEDINKILNEYRNKKWLH